MDDRLWKFVDGIGEWWSKSYGMPPMTGRVFAWLLVCDPVEQTAAQLAEALDASKGSISGATGMLVRAGLAERLHIRGERADRFRVRPDAWDEQIQDRGATQARGLLALGLEALADAPASRRERLEELDMFYAWWLSRVPVLLEEWKEFKRERLQRKRNG
jgi:DNA-binding transcriptional regulator GbsR (MarR family)